MIGRFAFLIGALLVACDDENELGEIGDAASDLPGAQDARLFDAGPRDGGESDGGSDGADGGGGGDGGDSGPGDGAAEAAVDGVANACTAALPLACGDRFNHSTVVQGRADLWSTYNWTAKLESGRETVYAFRTTSSCAVVANLKSFTTDLDLLLLSACDPIKGNLMASAGPIDSETLETLRWTSSPGQTYYVVVDGYDRSQGSYTLELDCACN